MNDFTKEVYDNTNLTKALYEAITNTIYDYLCFHRIKEELTMLPNVVLVNQIRFETMLFLKDQMDMHIKEWRNE